MTEPFNLPDKRLLKLARYWKERALRSEGSQTKPPRRQMVYAPYLGTNSAHMDTGAPIYKESDPRALGKPANLISSYLDSQRTLDPQSTLHCPVIDFDFPCRLIPSETPDHFHLFIDKPITWDTYVPLLRAFANAGLVESGYAQASIARGASFVATKPWKKK